MASKISFINVRPIQVIYMNLVKGKEVYGVYDGEDRKRAATAFWKLKEAGKVDTNLLQTACTLYLGLVGEEIVKFHASIVEEMDKKNEKAGI